MPPFFFCKDGQKDTQLDPPSTATCLFTHWAPVRKVFSPGFEVRGDSTSLVCVNGGVSARVWVVSWPWV